MGYLLIVEVLLTTGDAVNSGFTTGFTILLISLFLPFFLNISIYSCMFVFNSGFILYIIRYKNKTRFQ